MTRLEKQLHDMEQKLANYKNLANKATALFDSKKQEVIKVLKAYGYKETELDTSNSFIDESTFNGTLFFRLFIKFPKLTGRKEIICNSKLKDIFKDTGMGINLSVSTLTVIMKEA